MNVITKIEVCKRNKERVNLFIDEEFAFSISSELVFKKKLEVKKSVDIDSLRELAYEDSIIKCKNSALKIIERSYKTQKEIVDKLILKGFDKKVVDIALDFLKEYNFLNDEAYAKMYIKDKIKKEGKGKIKYALIRKGVSEELILEQLENVEDDQMRTVAKELAEKKLRVLEKREKDERILSQKLYRYLMGKGYGYDLISSVVREIIRGEE